MGDNKKLIKTDTKVDEKTEDKGDGVTVKTITTTIVESYDDGSTLTKTQVQTITEGATMQKIDPITGKPTGETFSISDAKKNAKRTKVTTDKKFLKAALEAHNDCRKKHGAPKLELDDDLCQVAQAWADKIAEDDKLQHSESGYGENIHWTSADLEDGKAPVEHWYSEIASYDFNKLEHQRGTGHFSQVIWKGSKKLGIAKAKGKKGGTYVVANYDPAGNFIGKYSENIAPPKK